MKRDCDSSRVDAQLPLPTSPPHGRQHTRTALGLTGVLCYEMPRKISNGLVVKPSLGPRSGTASPPLTFDAAYALLKAAGNSGIDLVSRGGRREGRAFTATAGIISKGAHKGERVIRFHKDSKLRAYALRECWNHKTNVNATHIDCYSEMILG